MAILNELPPPPRFATQGPSTTDDWAVFYRWLNNLFQVLLTASQNGQKASVTNPISIPNLNLRGQVDDISGLVYGLVARSSGGSVRSGGYVANAVSSPLTITAGTHGQGNLFVVQCYTGTLVSGYPSGFIVFPEVDLGTDGSGDVTIRFAIGTVGSVLIKG